MSNQKERVVARRARSACDRLPRDRLFNGSANMVQQIRGLHTGNHFCALSKVRGSGMQADQGAEFEAVNAAPAYAGGVHPLGILQKNVFRESRCGVQRSAQLN